MMTYVQVYSKCHKNSLFFVLSLPSICGYFSVGERPFECDICQKRFTLKHSMMRHRRKHTATELADASALHRSISPGGVSDDDTLMPHADVTGMSALAHADGESINNNVKHLPPVDDVAARAQLAAMMTSQPSPFHMFQLGDFSHFVAG